MATAGQPPRGFLDRLITALQQDDFVLYAQPIVPVASPRGEGLFQEIFVRFKEEDFKLLPPGAFLPVLEECHLLPYLDRWVVNRLARWVRDTQSGKPAPERARSNVNLSGQTLADPHFGTYVRKYVDGSYLADGALAFEVTWEAALDHLESLQRLMAELRPHGCAFAIAGIDGSERAFDVLKTVAPDFVKINVVGVPAERIAEINRQCHLLGARTIAEHVETDQALARLRQMKVDFAQGIGIAPVAPLA
jgi:EAL domain-containing protein (putative c-di-GMP-specific phosphodiesterase class I)